MKKLLRRVTCLLVAMAMLLPALPASAGNHLTLPEEELSAYAKEVGALSFVTNDGAVMTYDSAVGEICDRVQGYARALHPALAEEQLAAMRRLISDRLYLQQYGTDLRCVGDHGIRHIYGNIGRSLHLLKDRDDAAKLTATVAQIYHDIGYTDPDILYGEPDEDGEIVYASKFDHDLRSWDFFVERDLAFWRGLALFSDRDLAVMEKAVALHNCNLENYAKQMGRKHLTEEEEDSVAAMLRECRDVNVDAVVAAVHLGDKLALSEREKMAMTVASTPAIVGDLTRAYGVEMMKKAVDDEVYAAFSDRLLAVTMEEAKKGPGRGFFRTEAFVRDVTPESGKRFIPMNLIQTDGDCLTMEERDGVLYARVLLKALDYDEGAALLGEKWASRQFLKFFTDVGISKEEAPDYVRRAFAGPVELPGMHLVVEIRKEAMGAEDERRETRRAILGAMQDSPVCRWGLAYREIRAACKAGDVSDPVVLKMEALLGETEPSRVYLDAFREAAEPGEREPKALLKAFNRCLSHSALQDAVEELWREQADSIAA